MTTEQIVKLFFKAKANWNYINKQTQEELETTLELWREELKNCNFEDVNKALTEHMRKKGTFFPAIADLLKYSLQSEESRIKEAVAKFRECLKKGGSIKVDDVYIAWAIKNIGGWDYCRRYEIDKIEWLIKSFESEYSTIIQRNIPENIDNLLLADIHINNLKEGLYFRISYVGDQEKAEKLYLECKGGRENCNNSLKMLGQK